MSYDDVIDGLADRVDGLAPGPRAAVFWLVGTALRAELSATENAGWAAWCTRASDLSLAFVLDGRVGDEVAAVWGSASQNSGAEDSQVLHSVILCLSTPLAIALEPQRRVGAWVEHGLFPVIQKVSLDLFDDVAFPDDERLEEVFADQRVQAAVECCTSLCVRLENAAGLDRETLDQLLQGASVLNGQ